MRILTLIQYTTPQISLEVIYTQNTLHPPYINLSVLLVNDDDKTLRDRLWHWTPELHCHQPPGGTPRLGLRLTRCFWSRRLRRRYRPRRLASSVLRRGWVCLSQQLQLPISARQFGDWTGFCLFVRLVIFTQQKASAQIKSLCYNADTMQYPFYFANNNNDDDDHSRIVGRSLAG
jgi:hypothetical protein